MARRRANKGVFKDLCDRARACRSAAEKETFIKTVPEKGLTAMQRMDLGAVLWEAGREEYFPSIESFEECLQREGYEM